MIHATKIPQSRVECGWRIGQPLSALNSNPNQTYIVSDELDTARERKRQTEERAKQYYDRIRRQEAEVAELQRTLKASQERMAELQRQKTDLDKRMAELQKNIDLTNHTNGSLQRDIENHRQGIAADQVQMEKYNSEVQQLDHLIAGLMRRR